MSSQHLILVTNKPIFVCIFNLKQLHTQSCQLLGIKPGCEPVTSRNFLDATNQNSASICTLGKNTSRWVTCHNKGEPSGALRRLTTKSRQQYATLFNSTEKDSITELSFWLPFESTRELKQWSSGFVGIDSHTHTVRMPDDRCRAYIFPIVINFPIDVSAHA